jgi:hypothetical protein
MRGSGVRVPSAPPPAEGRVGSPGSRVRPVTPPACAGGGLPGFCPIGTSRSVISGCRRPRPVVITATRTGREHGRSDPQRDPAVPQAVEACPKSTRQTCPTRPERYAARGPRAASGPRAQVRLRESRRVHGHRGSGDTDENSQHHKGKRHPFGGTHPARRRCVGSVGPGRRRAEHPDLTAAGAGARVVRKCMDPPHRRAGGQAPGGNRSAISLVAGGVAPARSHLEANGGACLLMLTQVYTDGASSRHFRQIGPDFNKGCRRPPFHAC